MSARPAVSTPYIDDVPDLSLPPSEAAGRSRLKRLFVAFIALILTIVLSLGVLALSPLTLESLSAIVLKPQPATIPWNGRDRITLVAMGLTQRTTEPARTDTLLVIDINPSSHQINMLSVPRDLWVNIPGYGQGKLAIAYEIGGPKLAAYTLEHELGIPVDYTLALTFRGFIKLIDAMGGVTVNVPQELNDPTYPCLVGYAYCPIDIKPGVQHMSGATALEFVRERHAFTQQDLARVQDQQAFSDAVKSELISPSEWARYPAVLRAFQSSLSTNLPLNDLPAMGVQYLLTPKSRVDHEYININNGMVQPGWSNDGQSILQPTSATAIPNLVHRLFSDGTLAQESTPVEVLNGTGNDGLATDVGTTLGNLGFHVAGEGNASGTSYPHTEVIVNTAASGPADYTARRLQRLLSASLTREAMPAGTPRIVVIVGQDFPAG